MPNENILIFEYVCACKRTHPMIIITIYDIILCTRMHYTNAAAVRYCILFDFEKNKRKKNILSK